MKCEAEGRNWTGEKWNKMEGRAKGENKKSENKWGLKREVQNVKGEKQKIKRNAKE